MAEATNPLKLDDLAQQIISNDLSIGWQQEVAKLIDENPELDVKGVLLYRAHIWFSYAEVSKAEHSERAKRFEALWAEVHGPQNW